MGTKKGWEKQKTWSGKEEKKKSRTKTTITGFLQGWVSTATSRRNWECLNWHAKHSESKTCETRGRQWCLTLNARKSHFVQTTADNFVCVPVCFGCKWVVSTTVSLGEPKVPSCGSFSVSAALQFLWRHSIYKHYELGHRNRISEE